MKERKKEEATREEKKEEEEEEEVTSKRKKKRGEEEQCTYKPMCKCISAFLSIKQPHFLPSVFFLFWGELFGGPGKKTHVSQLLFSSLFTQPNTLQKNFHFHFLSKKKIYPPYFTYVKKHFSLSTKIFWRGHLYIYMCSISTYVSRKIWSALVCRQKALIINTNP